jgi:hypothetical protein
MYSKIQMLSIFPKPLRIDLFMGYSGINARDKEGFTTNHPVSNVEGIVDMQLKASHL